MLYGFKHEQYFKHIYSSYNGNLPPSLLHSFLYYCITAIYNVLVKVTTEYVFIVRNYIFFAFLFRISPLLIEFVFESYLYMQYRQILHLKYDIL